MAKFTRYLQKRDSASGFPLHSDSEGSGTSRIEKRSSSEISSSAL